MLPVLAYGEWQVETVEVDLGGGLHEWIEIRHGHQRTYAVSVAERDVILRAHDIDPARLAPLDEIDDGCE